MKKNCFNKTSMFLVMIITFLMFCPNAYAFNVCEKSGIVKSFQIIGYALMVVKIVVPLLLMIIGAVDLGKATLSSDQNAITAAVSLLTKRAIAAVVIFFIPTIIAFVMSLVDGSNKLNKFDACSKCISKPTQCVIPNDGGVFSN